MTGTPAFLPVGIAGIEPEGSAPPAGRVISGEPRFTTWNVEDAGGLFAGIWEATPGKWRLLYEEWEFCHILSGISVIVERGGEAQAVRAGDSFVLKPGFQGNWEVAQSL